MTTAEETLSKERFGMPSRLGLDGQDKGTMGDLLTAIACLLMAALVVAGSAGS